MIMRWLFRLSAMAIVLSAAMAGYWLWLDNPVLVTHFSRTILNKGKIRPGDLLKIDSTWCQTRPIVANSANRWLTNTYTYPFSDQSTKSSAPGCYHTTIRLQLPPAVITGAHQYHFSATYQVNPLKQLTYETPPTDFIVSP